MWQSLFVHSVIGLPAIRRGSEGGFVKTSRGKTFISTFDLTFNRREVRVALCFAAIMLEDV